MRKLRKLKNALWEAENDSEEFLRRKERYLTAYYKERRKYEKSFLAKLSLKQKQRLHKPLLAAIKCNNVLSGRRYEVLFDKRVLTDRPQIFAVTHSGWHDIEMVSCVIKSHYYLLTNGFEGLYHTLDGAALTLNGVIFFNHIVKEDRNAAAKEAVNVLKNGGNIMIFPEGAYNITPDLPVMPLNWGVIELAYQGRAQIVPVAVEQYGNHYKICIGSFDAQIVDNSAKEKAAAICKLREVLAELKWQIWETEPMAKRKEFSGDYWERCVADALAGGDDTVDDCKREKYYPKDIITCEEAFAFMDRLIPSRANAFLLRK